MNAKNANARPNTVARAKALVSRTENNFNPAPGTAEAATNNIKAKITPKDFHPSDFRKCTLRKYAGNFSGISSWNFPA